jgi:hypothetical protein
VVTRRKLASWLTITIAAAFLSVVVINIASYLHMSTLPVEVVKSSMRFDVYPMSGRLYYGLRLELAAMDGSGRKIPWEEGLSEPMFPEEALDELRRWEPGTRHSINTLRGQTGQVRLPYGQQSPELTNATWAFWGFLPFAVLALVIPTWTSLGGSWQFNLLMALAVPCFLIATLRYQAWIRPSWPVITATIEDPSVDYDALPANVEVTPAAKAVITRLKYRVVTYTLNDLQWHGGVGLQRLRTTRGRERSGHFHWIDPALTSCRFRQDPHNRWNISAEPVWGYGSIVLAWVGFFVSYALVGAAWRSRPGGADWSPATEPLNQPKTQTADPS